jgi:hypothetical protein
MRIDAASLASSDAAVGLRHIAGLLREVEQLRSGGHLIVSTPREIALRLQPKRTVAARSILRAA